MGQWQYALAQHPMYLIVRECATCAERTPPWGEPSIDGYVARIRRNVEALRRHRHLRLGYEWSGLELEQLAEDDPEVLGELRALAATGKIAFYNGTYAQPHLQVLSSEANYRQFEQGARVYRDLLAWQVGTYAHQEASVHDQVPQLLRAFGIRFAVMPRFATTLRWLEGGELVVLDWQGPRFVEGHEFVRWEGLDGSQVPLYLQLQRSGTLDDWLAAEEMAGRLRVPPLFVKVPDLVEIDDDWLERHREAELVLLDEAIPERLRRHPARGRARFSSNWSYVEGIRAEALTRTGRGAEAAALLAEALGALAFAVLGRPPASLDRVWRTILAAQHHDVACFGAPDLRDRALCRLEQATRTAGDLADEAALAVVANVDCTSGPGRPVVVVNPVPHACRVLVSMPSAVASVTDSSGAAVPADASGGRLRFLADFGGAGYATYWARPARGASEPERTDAPVAFENGSYSAVVQPDGTFSSLALVTTGDELIGPRPQRGNQLTATDSTAVSPRREAEGEREDWQRPSRRPSPRVCERRGPAVVRRHDLGLTLTTELDLGPGIGAALAVDLFHDLPRVDLTWRFRFDVASVGTFYDDDSKLCVRWPLAIAGEVVHDIAFGVVAPLEGLPFLPATWTDVSDGSRGLAYLHQGTPKHWMSGGVLTNLFAWGEDTEAIGSRMWRHNWPRAFDQRLSGTHVIRCAVVPHRGDWREADLVGIARGYNAPPWARLTEPHAGPLPPCRDVLALADRSVCATALTTRGGDVLCRLYALGAEPARVTPRSSDLAAAGLRSLADGPVERVAPFQIAELTLRRTSPG
jgi:alpha-mannosidase